MVVELRKRKEKPAPAEAPKKATKKVEKRKAAEDGSPVAVKKQKSISRPETQKKTKEPKAKASRTKKVVEEREEKEAKEEEDGWSGIEEGDEVDAQTKALVKTLDSGDEGEEAEEENVGTYKNGQDVGKAPKASGKVAKPARVSKPEDRGTIYVGHIPFGFFEHQMREYFSQFGDVTRIRLSRNKKTGASKHYGFVEFADAEVAEIVAKTMDKYLLFGCILAVRVVPPSQIHPDLWKGANRRWKTFDRNAAEGRQLVARAGESQWNERVSKEEARRAKRAEKLKEMGYDFEAPKLKVAVAKDTPAIENGEQEPVKAIEAPPAAAEAKETEKVEVTSKEVEAAPEAEEPEAPKEAVEKPAPKKTKAGNKGTKAAKGKKAKS